MCKEEKPLLAGDMDGNVNRPIGGWLRKQYGWLGGRPHILPSISYSSIVMKSTTVATSIVVLY